MNNKGSKKSIVIIGNGISGTTLARHIRKNSSYAITIISDETPYFFSRTALMYVYMGHLPFSDTEPYEPKFWKDNSITLLQQRVTRILPEKKLLQFDDSRLYSYDTLVIATGSKPNFLGWPGQNLKAVQGLYHKQDVDQLESWTASIQNAVIVGGGLIGIELAEMLHSRGKKVHFLIRESHFWNTVLPQEEAELVTQHIIANGIDLHLNTELKSITSDEEGRANGVYTKEGALIPCQWVGLSVGVSPNIAFLDKSDLQLNKGILVNQYLETNQKGIYAIGDCAEQTEPQQGRAAIEAVWYTGRMMGETLAQTLTGKKTPYTPGPWFNSAKFFNIEYQIYGKVSVAPDSQEERQLLWKHKSKNRTIRISYDPTTLRFLGCMSLGVRFRHAYFDAALRNHKNMEYILSTLDESFFDPEFYPTYKKEIQMLWELEKSNLIL
ncbi:MAG: FAD/NAD(P)-binding oxidoreductase [Bacteroidetes bacterium]|nr:FAD/NAD(P)-binding oxidoreductase [Bacteroidota bacterium]